MKYTIGEFYGYPVCVECEQELPEKFFAERFEKYIKNIKVQAVEEYKQTIKI